MFNRVAPLRLLIALLLLLATGAASALAAQDGLKDPETDNANEEFPGLVADGEYVSPQFDVEIAWTDDWAVGDPNNPDVAHAIGGNFDGPVASDSQLGDIVFLVDAESETSVLSLGMSPDDVPMDADILLGAMEQPEFLTQNLFLSEDAEVLLLDTDGESVAIVAREAVPNDAHIVYLLIETTGQDAGYTFWLGLDMFDADEYERILNTIEDDIDVDGHDPFPVFDVDEMLDAVDAGSNVATEEPATEEPATEEPATEESATEVAATEEAIIIPPVRDSTPAATPAASPVADGTPAASPAASPVAGELPGLSAPGDYVSPQHDVAVTWTDDWMLDPAHTPAILSHSESGLDEVYLADSATGAVQMYISIEPTSGLTDPDELLAALSEPAYMENFLRLSPDSEVVLSRTQTGRVALAYVDDSGSQPLAVILEVHVLDDDTLLFIEMRGNIADIDEDMLELAEDTIEAGGEDAMDILDATDVVAAFP